MSAHAFLAPSSMGITVKCSYAPHANAAYPQPDTLETLEGEASHYAFETICNHFRFTGKRMENPPSTIAGSRDKRGTYITHEMVENAEQSATHCLNLITNQQAFDTLKVEHKVQIPQVHPDKCFGTMDFSFYDPTTRTIYIRDYKYGYLLVEVYENWQLLCYLIGLLNEYPDALYFDIGICQPRPYHWHGSNRWWRGEVQHLPYYIDILAKAAQAVFNNPMTSSGDHCRFCPAALKCQAFIESTNNAIDVVREPTMHELSDVELAKLYQMADRATNAIKYLKDRTGDLIKEKIDKGERIPGYTLGTKQGNSYWDLGNDEMIALFDLLGVDNAVQTKPKTPLSVLDKMKKNDPNRDLLSPLMRRKSSVTQIIPDDGREAERIFNT